MLEFQLIARVDKRCCRKGQNPSAAIETKKLCRPGVGRDPIFISQHVLIKNWIPAYVGKTAILLVGLASTAPTACTL